jgi:hypothetical protein
MRELKAIDARRGGDQGVNPTAQFYIIKEDDVSMKAGDEFLLMVGDPKDPAKERYGFAVRISDKGEPEEDEMLVQYGEDLFVAQKLPEFI